MGKIQSPLVWQVLCQTEAMAPQSSGKFSNLFKDKGFEVYGIFKYLGAFPIADKTSELSPTASLFFSLLERKMFPS